MMHKVMVAEAAARFSLTRASLVNWLQHHRERIADLDEFRQAVAEVRSLPLRVLTPDLPTLAVAADIAKRESLLTNDALTAALMRRDGLIHLATNDDDFDTTGITVWKPR
jgi:predicted nucleic acid-binding protein